MLTRTLPQVKEPGEADLPIHQPRDLHHPALAPNYRISMINYQDVVDIAIAAGREIMAIYQQDFGHYQKADSSPLTDADLAAHQLICGKLHQLTPHIPLLSEEAADLAWDERSQWHEYWLIDPLDGTKEFIKKNGEFTVNIAHIKAGEPIWGVVYAPATQTIYAGGPALGQSYKSMLGKHQPLQVLPVKSEPNNWVLVGSRSHQSLEFAQFVQRFDQPDIKSMGSSLKICMVAEGLADIYPRLGLTSEWDTAAAHAVLLGAGGTMVDAECFNPLKYNQKDSLLNPYFIAANGLSSLWAKQPDNQLKA